MPRTPTVKSLVDQLGKLQKKLKPFKALKDEADSIEKDLIDLLDLNPEEARHVTGLKFAGTVSACGFKREITDKPALIKLLGDERYMDESKILLGRLDELVKEGVITAKDLEPLITETQNGPRKVVILPKAA